MPFSATSVRALSVAGALVLAPLAPHAAVVLDGPVELAATATGAFLDLQLESNGNVFIDLEDFAGFSFLGLNLHAGHNLYMGALDEALVWPHGLGAFTVETVTDALPLAFTGNDILLRPDGSWEGAVLTVSAGQDIQVYGLTVSGSGSGAGADGGNGAVTSGAVTIGSGSTGSGSGGGGVPDYGNITIGGSMVTSGTVSVGGTGPNEVGISGTINFVPTGGGTVTLDLGNAILVATPLPGAVWLLLSALALVGMGARRTT